MKALDSVPGTTRTLEVVEENDNLMAIGTFARASGLSPKALRLYERLELLMPALVDPANGYRYYASAQLRAAGAIKGLRAIGMPLRSIAAVLVAEPVEAHRLIDEFWDGIESQLGEARQVVASMHTLIAETEEPMSPTLTTTLLNDGLERVLFAASSDPERPILGSVLIRGGADSVRLVATDSYRLVECVLPGAGFQGDLLVHRDNLADLAAALQEAADVTLGLAEGSVVLTAGDQELRLPLQDGDFPKYELLMPTSCVASLTAKAGALLALADRGVADGAEAIDLVLGSSSSLGGTAVEGSFKGEPLTIALNPRYLAEGLGSIPGDTVLIEAETDMKPISLRPAKGEGFRYVLMPVRRA